MKLIADYELSALLVTRSEQGMSLLQPGKSAAAYANPSAGSV